MHQDVDGDANVDAETHPVDDAELHHKELHQDVYADANVDVEAHPVKDAKHLDEQHHKELHQDVDADANAADPVTTSTP